MDELLSTTPLELGDLLRRSRELVGWSRAEAASRLGLSWDSVRQAEEGRDVRRSTLAAWLRALPFLSPRALLEGDASAPPLASVDVWHFHARLHGFCVRTLSHVVELAPDGLARRRIDARGVRWLEGDATCPLRRADLMKAVFVGTGAALRHLSADAAGLVDGVHRVETDDAVHEYRFARSARAAFDYSCTFGIASLEREPALQSEPTEAARRAPAVAVDVNVPVERLELVVQFPPGADAPAAAFFLSPEMACAASGAIALARATRPGGAAIAWDASTRRLSVSVDRPALALRHGLAWLDQAGPLPAGFVTPSRATKRRVPGLAPSVADRARAARERAGLSSRELARRMGASPATVMELESGKDPRASTIRRVLAALPDLRAEDLFPDVGRERGRRDLSPREVWLHDRNAWGVQADEASRTLTLNAKGDGREEIATGGLRRLHAGQGDLIVKDGISRSAHGRIGPVFLEQSNTGDQELRVRWMRAPGDAPEFQLVVPASLAAAGVSFSRTDRKEQAYKMRAEHSDRSIGPAYECFVPLRRLVMTVRFPKGCWPERFGAFARAGVNVTNPRWRDLAEELHEEAFRLVEHRERHAVELVVERPLLGYRYSITWQAR